MLNHIVIMGRLTRDPELKHTQQGTAVVSFTVACERDFASSGDKVTDFIPVTAWRATAEFIARYFSKGRMIAVSGRLQKREWTDGEGARHEATEIVADSAYFADSKREDAPPAQAYRASTPVDVSASDFAELDEDDGDLPF